MLGFIFSFHFVIVFPSQIDNDLITYEIVYFDGNYLLLGGVFLLPMIKQLLSIYLLLMFENYLL